MGRWGRETRTRETESVENENTAERDRKQNSKIRLEEKEEYYDREIKVGE